MATQRAIGVVVSGTISGNSPETRKYPEAASQTFKKGEPVYLVSGYITEFTADADTGSQRLLGFAAEDAHNSTAGAYDVAVFIGNADTIFMASVYHATDASAVTAITQPATQHPLYRDTTNSLARVDIGDTEDKIKCCEIVEVVKAPGFAVGDKYGWVKFFIDEASRQFEA